MTETHRVEYKRELTDSLEKEVIAFLNSREGGRIFIGVDDSGKAVGVPNIDQVQLAIKDRLKHNITPSILGLFDLQTEIRDAQKILKITVASGSENLITFQNLECRPKDAF
jgi:ATP-dependent DNA helicase RecG